MAKQTVFIDSPTTLTTKHKQIVITKEDTIFTLSPEDVQVIILNHPQITISSCLIGLLAEYNVALLTCNSKHLPISMCLAANKATKQYETAQIQLKASKPLRKQLWQKIIKAKIINQAQVLKMLHKPYLRVQNYAKNVSSGDTNNREAIAAKVYFNLVLPDSRRNGVYSDALDFGYALIRASIARSLCASGFLLFYGIHHKNISNPFNLADDLMESFRPLVDYIVVSHCIKSPLTHISKMMLYRLFEYTLESENLDLPLEESINATVYSLKKALKSSDSSIFTLPSLMNIKETEVE